MRSKKVITLFSITGFVFLIGFLFGENGVFSGPGFHTPEEKQTLQAMLQVPIDSNEYFLHSENCRTCHGHDTVGYANVDQSGNDVNLFDDWQSTMMANSAKDPLWRAKVSHEILVDPAHSLALQDKCTSCHAPMGHFTSVFKGNPHYGITELDNDTLGLDGVSCTGCHTIGPNGNQYSGNIPYDTLRNEYGPFYNPNTGPMQLYVGLTPTYSSHMESSRVCSSCHTLQVASTDLSGVPTGRTFTEQATFHEWENSGFAQDNVTCQNCHMPQVLDSVVIANGYLNLPPRSPFNRHKFMGGNAFMIDLIKNNKNKLGITVPDIRFDSTLAITKKNLRYNSVDLKILQDSITVDTAYYRVRLMNKAGHKFPSGYPSRRAVLQFVVVGTMNDTLFRSGIFNTGGEVVGIGTPFEPHYELINSSGQNQVYEMVMGDVTGTRTTVLERADTTLKDNRLPPEGFVSTASVYDTVKIVGNANNDADFNKFSGGVEGSGKDFVHFRIPIAGFPPVFSVYSRMYYQSVPPAWLQEMFSYSSAPIDSFKLMYNSANKAPNLVDADSIMNIAVGIAKNKNLIEVIAAPDPSSDGNLDLLFSVPTEVSMIRILDLNGRVLSSMRVGKKVERLPIRLPEEKGTYIIDIYIDNSRITRKVIRL
ncbi:MAG: T9SS type A sorting domain-containing protein [Bacteroidia bacterium]